MADVWLSTGQVAELTGWTDRHVRRALKAARLSKSAASNGKREREYLLSSLPAAAQLKYAAGAGQKAALAVVPQQSPEALPLFAALPEVSAAERLAVPEGLQDQVRARLAAISPLLDFRRRTNGHRPVIELSGGRKVDTLNDYAEYLAGQQRPAVSSRTLFRWLDRFDAGGYAALAERPRKDRGRSRFFEEHAAAAVFLHRKYLEEGLSRQMSWEALRRDWKQIEKTGTPPSYSAAARFLNMLPEPLSVLGREGPEAHGKRCSPFLQRGPRPAMEWWISDHRKFDVLVRNTLFAELKPEEAYRPWLTAIYDWGTRKIVGWCFAPTPSSRTINSALRLAVLSHGFPQNFYWDNGEDFKKVRRDLELITLSDEAKAVMGRESIGITSALPFHPRSKPIEAYFTRWSRRFDVLWRPAYLGNQPGNKPESARTAEALHQKHLKGKRAESPLPTDAEFILAAMQWIEEFNDAPLGALQHRTPNEAMNEQYPERNRPQINPRLLDVLFSERDKRVIQAGGCVQLDGMRYEPTDSSLFALDMRKGQQAMILRDPYNLGEAVAADPETLQFLGELRIQELVAQCPNGQITRDQIKAGMRRERALRRGYAEYLAALSAIAANLGWQTEREALVGRALARTGTDSRLLGAAAPGALRGQPQLPPPARKPRAAFVSDTIAADAEVFAEVALEDGHAAADD